MITYRDRTYCTNTECKKECSCRLTDKILKAAEEYGLPVSMACYDCEAEDANI